MGPETLGKQARKDQAKILFNDAVSMVDQSPDLAKRITQSGGPGRVFNMAWLAKGSFFRPLSRSAGKSGSGLRPHIGLADELHEHPNRDAVEMIERGFKFRRQPLLLMITNSGSDRNSICYEEHEHAVRVAAGTMTPGEDFAYVGEVIDDTTFSFVRVIASFSRHLTSVFNALGPVSGPFFWLTQTPRGRCEKRRNPPILNWSRQVRDANIDARNMT